MSAHTTGPWKARASDLDARKLLITGPRIGAGTQHGRDAHKLIAGVSPAHLEAEANARLIAAAPELLDALELCAEKLALWPEGSNPEFFPSLKAARAAIAAAKGTPS